jgi:GNAT superfamily N-acetyltransferase
MTSEPITAPSHRAEIHVRPYRPSDQDFVLSLSSRLTIGMAPWRDPEKMRVVMRQFTQESTEKSNEATTSNAIVFIAENADGQVLGFASVAHNVNFTGEVQAYIGELVVSAEAEGQGVGHALIAAVEDWARTRGYTILVLDTGAANHRARAFYEQQGYQEESVRLVKVL